MTQDKLLKIMKEQGWKQADLARLINADPIVVNRWVRGRATMSSRYERKIRSIINQDVNEEKRMDDLNRIIELLEDKVVLLETQNAMLREQIEFLGKEEPSGGNGSAG